MSTKVVVSMHLIITKWKPFGCIFLLGIANIFFRFLNQAGDFMFSSFAFWATRSSKKWNQFKLIFSPEIYVDFINLYINPERKNSKIIQCTISSVIAYMFNCFIWEYFFACSIREKAIRQML